MKTSSHIFVFCLDHFSSSEANTTRTFKSLKIAVVIISLFHLTATVKEKKEEKNMRKKR